jgi:hypothetical protein
MNPTCKSTRPVFYLVDRDEEQRDAVTVVTRLSVIALTGTVYMFTLQLSQSLAVVYSSLRSLLQLWM